jgi:actin-related protein 6
LNFGKSANRQMGFVCPSFFRSIVVNEKAMTTLIIDNGGGNVKVGFAQQDEPNVFPNCTAKMKKSMQFLVAEQIFQCQNSSLLDITRPFDRGYLTNWQSEIEVWSHLFRDTHKCNPAETSLLVTEPLLNPFSVQSDMNEIIFEYFGFKECLRRPAPWFSANDCMNYQHLDEEKLPACCIVDSGFSFTHVAPFLNGKCHRKGVSFFLLIIIVNSYLLYGLD